MQIRARLNSRSHSEKERERERGGAEVIQEVRGEIKEEREETQLPERETPRRGMKDENG